MSLKNMALASYLSGYFKQDHKLFKTYALTCGYLSKFIKHPGFLTHVSKMPINFCVLITYRCSRNCESCFFLDKLNKKDRPDMDLKAARELEASPIFRTAIRVGLLGGEPLINEDVYDIVGYLKSKGHIVSITSNGDVLTTEKARELKKAGLDLLILSYYKDNNEAISNFMGSLAENVFERRRVALACHSESIGDIEQAYEFAKQNNIGTLLPRFTYDFASGRSLTEEQKKQIWRDFKKFGENVAREGLVRLTPLRPYTYFMNHTPYCQNALMTYIVGPDFEISPCCQPVSRKYGTIYDYKASEKFKEAVFYKDTIHKMCLNCPVLGGGNFL